MSDLRLEDLQESVRDTSAFNKLDDYSLLSHEFLEYLKKADPTKIVSPTQSNYIFFQYDKRYKHNITRPINSDLFITSPKAFTDAYERFTEFLGELKEYQDNFASQEKAKQYLATNEINKVVYTMQQSVGSIGDSFPNPNQSRKRAGQLFEVLIKLIIQDLGLECEPRTIQIPIPEYPHIRMSYELDLVFSRNATIVTSETKFLHPTEVVGSVKTTSKDRLDKVFLDKFLLSKLLGREVPVIAVFLHDVQRARKGNSIFGINSTFKSNHFLGYTAALNPLDGVYYVDPRPEMTRNPQLKKEIHDFQQLIVHDLWALSKKKA